LHGNQPSSSLCRLLLDCPASNGNISASPLGDSLDPKLDTGCIRSRTVEIGFEGGGSLTPGK
jgi:hypothetical protein